MPPPPSPQNLSADASGFATVLRQAMSGHGDTPGDLARRLGLPTALIRGWTTGAHTPRLPKSLDRLAGIEAVYGLQPGCLSDALQTPSTCDRALPPGVRLTDAQRRHHVPKDDMTAASWSALCDWLTDTFAEETPDRPRQRKTRAASTFRLHRHTGISNPGRVASGLSDWSLEIGERQAGPRRIIEEWRDLSAFQTSPRTRAGFNRRRAWRLPTLEVYAGVAGRAFTDLLAALHEERNPSGATAQRLGFALFAFPRTWELIIKEASGRRGYASRSEIVPLVFARAICNPRTGWLAQSPHLAEGLAAIPGLVSEEDRLSALKDWRGHCGRTYDFLGTLRADLRRLCSGPADTTGAIAAILRDPDPLRVYARIADNIWRHRPHPHHRPMASANHVRDYLAIRIGMHTGLRSRNLRELQLNDTATPTPASDFRGRTTGEIRRGPDGGAWEVYLPHTAFKNESSLYRHLEFRVVLPDVDGLYERIEDYIDGGRRQLLRRGADPGWFFLQRRRGGAYLMTPSSFHVAWRDNVICYGIFNPWTGSGVVQGLRPHGPHAIRTIVATQVMKRTGSLQLAALAIRDNPRTAEKHYLGYVYNDSMEQLTTALQGIWRGETSLPAGVDRLASPGHGPVALDLGGGDRGGSARRRPLPSPARGSSRIRRLRR